MSLVANKTESRFKPTTNIVNIGEYFVCNCSVPLAKCTEEGYELLKYHNGKPIKVKITFDSMLRVKCEICGRGFAIINVSESMSIKDSVSISSSKC